MLFKLILHGSQQVPDHKEACRLIGCDFKRSYVPAFPFFSHSLLQVTLLHTIQWKISFGVSNLGIHVLLKMGDL